jgi:Replication factor RFC1 C terminal domain
MAECVVELQWLSVVQDFNGPVCCRASMAESNEGQACACRFTAWLGANSSAGKQRRLLGELHTRMSASGHISTDRTGLRTSYIPAFRPGLTLPLLREGKEGIDHVVSLMHVSANPFPHTDTAAHRCACPPRRPSTC